MTETIANAKWTEPENWAWAEIVAGRVANFGTRHGKPRNLDPRLKRGWEDDRTLGALFLRALLFDKEWAGKVPIMGVRIVGAVWREPLDLQHAQLAWPLCLEACRFEAPVDLNGLSMTARLSLRNSAFRGTLTLTQAVARRADLAGVRLAQGLAAAGAAIAGALDLDGAALTGALDLTNSRAESLLFRDGSADDVTLSHCEITQDVDFSGAIIRGATRMIDLSVGQDLLLGGSDTRPSVFKGQIVLVDAVVGGSLEMAGATVHGPLKGSTLEVKRNVFLRASYPSDEVRRTGETRFLDQVSLTNAVIHGYLEMLGTAFEGTVDLGSIHIMENLSAWPGETGPTEFRQGLLLSYARIKGSVDMSGAEFGLLVDMSGIRINGNLTVAQPSVFRVGLQMNAGWVGGDMDFSGTHFLGDVMMRAVKIDGNVYCNGSVLFGQNLDFADARIGGHFFIREGWDGSCPKCVAVLRLQNATVGGNAEFIGEFVGPLSLSGLGVALNLFIRQAVATQGQIVAKPIVHGPVDLAYADVKGVVDINGVRFENGLNLSNIGVGQDFRLAAEVWGPASLAGGDFGGGVDVSNSDLRSGLDLSAGKIAGQLRLKVGGRGGGSEPSAGLDLRDAKVGSLQVFGPEIKAPGWPNNGSVQLDGLVYDRLGGTDPDQTQEMAARSAKWLKKWLALDSPYSPQPYEQLAVVLRQAGEVEKANRVLHAARERARKSAWSRDKPFKLGIFRWLGLGALKITIGYGIGLRFFYALFWAAALTGFGVWFLGPDPVYGDHGVRLVSLVDKIIYSFDQLLPIVELDRNFSEIKLSGDAETYFQFHRLGGFLLGAFITAGIAGLTQRSRP